MFINFSHVETSLGHKGKNHRHSQRLPNSFNWNRWSPWSF